MFGERLRLLRTDKGLTQAQLGRVFSISPSEVGSFEREERRPSIQLLAELASYFSVSADYLLGLTDNREPVDTFVMNINYAQSLRTAEEIENVSISFSSILERDIDLLILEEFVSSRSFASLFLCKTEIGDEYEILSAKHSVTDLEHGESDIEIILQTPKGKHAILIEDKINAAAMPQQCSRYHIRAIQAMCADEYQSYSLFITAPQNYIAVNAEAQKYPLSLTYEEMEEYFSAQPWAESTFKLAQIQRALDHSKKSHDFVADPAVTEFWRKLRAFLSNHYPHLAFIYDGEEKGRRALWPSFRTLCKGVTIVWKSEKGNVDLEFGRSTENEILLANAIEKHLGTDMQTQSTGKSKVIRISVDKVFLKEPFEKQIDRVHRACQAISRLNDVARNVWKS